MYEEELSGVLAGTGIRLFVYSNSNGNFYGTATGREETIPGAVFRITPQGQITILVRFTGKNGKFPRSLMQANDGTFYGTTGQGGQGERGTVFRLIVN